MQENFDAVKHTDKHQILLCGYWQGENDSRNITGKNDSKQNKLSFKVSGNSPKSIEQMKKHSQEKARYEQWESVVFESRPTSFLPQPTEPDERTTAKPCSQEHRAPSSSAPGWRAIFLGRARHPHFLSCTQITVGEADFQVSESERRGFPSSTYEIEVLTEMHHWEY